MVTSSPKTRRGRTRRHETARRRAVALSAAGALFVLIALIAAPDRAGVTRASARTGNLRAEGLAPAVTTVTYNPAAPTIALPRSFFGFSVEVWDVLRDARYLPLFRRAIDLINVPGDGPEILRVGGNSTTRATGTCAPGGPAAAFELTRRWWIAARRIVDSLHLRVILGLNAVAHSPSMAAGWARAAVRYLPPRSIVGFEIGTSPISTATGSGTASWTHLRQRSPGALAGQAPERVLGGGVREHVRLVRRGDPAGRARDSRGGPAVSNPLRSRRWLTGVIDDDRGSLGFLTAHRYALSACYHTNVSPFYRPSRGCCRSAHPPG